MTFHFEWWYVHSILVELMGGCCGYNQNLVIDRCIGDEEVTTRTFRSRVWSSSGSEDMEAFDECYGSVGFKKRASVHAAEFIGTVTTYFVEAIPVELEG